MKEIWCAFQQLEDILSADHSIKEFQEIYTLAERLYSAADSRLAQELSHLACERNFLSDMRQLASKHLLGQCGDDVYWKICDRTLYICGSGPMWDFDSDPIGLAFKKGISPLWCAQEFDAIIILNGVSSIGVSAFEEVRASNVVIPSSVKTIAEFAFFNAHIERLMLPETLDTIEDGIVEGFSRVVDTLIISTAIPNIKPFAFHCRDDIVAKTITLVGEMPRDFTIFDEACLFNRIGSYKINYPHDWDNEVSFYDRLALFFADATEEYLQKLKSCLTPYKP